MTELLLLAILAVLFPPILFLYGLFIGAVLLIAIFKR